MRSDAQHDRTDHNFTETGDDGIKGNRGLFGHSKQKDSAATSINIPLVAVGSKATSGSESRPVDGHINGQILEPAETENNRVVRGDDAV